MVPFLGSILFEVACPFWKMWIWSCHYYCAWKHRHYNQDSTLFWLLFHLHQVFSTFKRKQKHGHFYCFDFDMKAVNQCWWLNLQTKPQTFLLQIKALKTFSHLFKYQNMYESLISSICPCRAIIFKKSIWLNGWPDFKFQGTRWYYIDICYLYYLY